MGNAVTGEHTQHDRACMHATCIRRRWPHPCPAHSLDLGPPHKLPAGRGRAEGPLPGAWGTSKATLNGLSSALSPSSRRSSGKSGGVSSPHLRVPPPHRKQTERETCLQGAPGFLLFSAFCVPGQGLVCYAHSPTSPRPKQRCREGAPLHLSPRDAGLRWACVGGPVCG